MTRLVKQIMYGGYHLSIPRDIFQDYLDKYYESGGRWDIFEAFDGWIDRHRKIKDR